MVSLLLFLSMMALGISLVALVMAWCAVKDSDEYGTDISNLNLRVSMAETVIKLIERKVANHD